MIHTGLYRHGGKKVKSFRWLRELQRGRWGAARENGLRPVMYCGCRCAGRQYNDRSFSNGNRVMGPGKDDQGNAPSLLQVLGSVLASMFGVQSNRRREQDFVHGKPSQYIVIGLLVTLVFILLVWGVVSLVMRLAGV